MRPRLAIGGHDCGCGSAAGVTLQALAQGSPLLKQSTVTLPTVTLNYLKNVVNARTLSNPRVRTVDGQAAKIHVGDRVPLQSASIQDATGQSRTMYEYHDIGIALDVIPKYHLDDSIFVDLNVEVSSLGQNLGTAGAPAFAIGTRNVHTTMILRESETAVLGGLISENEQHSLNGLPWVDPNGVLGTFVRDPRRYRAAVGADFDHHAPSRPLAIAAKAQQHRLLQRHREGLFDPDELRLLEQNASRQTAATIHAYARQQEAGGRSRQQKRTAQAGWQTTGYAR